MREATFFDVVDWAVFRRLTSYVVTGNSMLPTLKPGDRVLVTAGDYPFGLQVFEWIWIMLMRRPQPVWQSPVVVGDVVVCEHPLYRNSRIIKRVGALDISRDGVNKMTLYGDNHACGESNQGMGLFGDVSFRDYLGKVVAVVPRP